MAGHALMLQGTGSDVGKSLLVAGLARAFTRRGLAVLPFKPQNMSNNAAVTADGGEIGRAQALQARACGVMPTTDMNPVLLKPQSDGIAQLVVGGRVQQSVAARDYRLLAPSLLPAVRAAFERLRTKADLVLVEGAGSPAEINLRPGDIANMGFALAADVPVALVGDIERGGVIAQLVGTWALLAADERALIAGYIVNKFRGDIRLFGGGLSAIRQRTDLASFGVVPFFPAASLLPAEDSLALTPPHPVPLPASGERGRSGNSSPSPRWRGEGRGEGESKTKTIGIAVPLLPRIANFDDLDPLRLEPAVELSFVPPGRPLPRQADVVILPGSKATLADLAFLRQEGWDIDILAHCRHGGHVLGLCGGYQMLGRTIADPDGIEGAPATRPGLGLLAVDTVLGRSKRLAAVAGHDLATGAPVQGYEMHLGVTMGPGRERPMLRLAGRPDGAVSADGRIAGCYLHGLFAGDVFRRAFLARLGADAGTAAYETTVERTLDALADHLESHLDLTALLQAARPPRLTRAA